MEIYPFALESDYFLSIFNPNVDLADMILEDNDVSYQKMYELSDYCYSLVNACEKRKEFCHQISDCQVYSQNWTGWSFYQLSLDERMKFKKYSIDRIEHYFSSDENIYNFKNELLRIRNFATYSITKIIEKSIPGKTSNCQFRERENLHCKDNNYH